jgi:hypothetical protein
MRSSLMKLPLLALLAAGCERMPEDPVFMYGQVLHADGSPAEGAPLRVERALDTLEYAPGSPYYEGETTWEYTPYSEGTSEASGYFTLEALSGDLSEERYFPEGYYAFLQHRFRVYPPLAQDGHGVFVAFFWDDDVELPPLQPWASGLAVGDGPEGPRLTFAPAPPVPPLPRSASLPQIYDENMATSLPLPPSTPRPAVQLHAADGLLWQQLRASSPWAPGPYVLEDFTGVETQVRAVTVGEWDFEPLGAQYSPLRFRMEWRSPRLPLPAGGLRPLSRGASCSPLPGPGPCPFTDGKLAVVETRPGSTQPGPGNPEGFGVPTLTVSLDAPARPRRVVVRGLETTVGYYPRLYVVLEGSMDGLQWQPLAEVPFENYDESDAERRIYQFFLEDSEADSPFDGALAVMEPPVFVDVPLSGEREVRHVRLGVKGQLLTGETGPGRLWKLGEVSVFE